MLCGDNKSIDTSNRAKGAEVGKQLSMGKMWSKGVPSNLTFYSWVFKASHMLISTTQG